MSKPVIFTVGTGICVVAGSLAVFAAGCSGDAASGTSGGLGGNTTTSAGTGTAGSTSNGGNPTSSATSSGTTNTTGSGTTVTTGSGSTTTGTTGSSQTTTSGTVTSTSTTGTGTTNTTGGPTSTTGTTTGGNPTSTSTSTSTSAGSTGTGGGRDGGTGGASTGTTGRDGGRGTTTTTGGGAPDGSIADVVVADVRLSDAGAYVRTGWTAVYTCAMPPCPMSDTGAANADKATNAFDGNLGTRWSTADYQNDLNTKKQFPLMFTVDMKQVANVSKVTMNPGTQDMFDAPGSMDVYLSVDGTNFGTAVATGHKPAVAGGTDTITFPQGQGRYIRLVGTQSLVSVNPGATDRYWAIGEMNVYP